MRIARHEPGAVPGHVGALAQGVQHDDVREVAELQRRGGRTVVEPDLAVGLVEREEEVVTAREVGGALEERERRDGAGRVVRVVEPQDRRAVPRVGAHAVELGQEVGSRERESPHVSSGEPGAALRDGVAGRRHHHEIPSGRRIQRRLREGEDRLLAAERGDQVGRRIEGDAEPPIDPADDRLTELRETRRARVRGRRDDRGLQRLADERRRLVARVAHAEVDQRAPGVHGLLLAPVELLERIRLDVPDPR